MSNFYQYLYSRGKRALASAIGIATDDLTVRKHPDGSPCNAKTPEACPFNRREKKLDEADKLDPNAGMPTGETPAHGVSRKDFDDLVNGLADRLLQARENQKEKKDKVPYNLKFPDIEFPSDKVFNPADYPPPPEKQREAIHFPRRDWLDSDPDFRPRIPKLDKEHSPYFPEDDQYKAEMNDEIAAMSAEEKRRFEAQKNLFIMTGSTIPDPKWFDEYGTVKQRSADGTEIRVDENGRESTVLPDGTVHTTDEEGQNVTIYADGRVKIHPKYPYLRRSAYWDSLSATKKIRKKRGLKMPDFRAGQVPLDIGVGERPTHDQDKRRRLWERHVAEAMHIRRKRQKEGTWSPLGLGGILDRLGERDHRQKYY